MPSILIQFLDFEGTLHVEQFQRMERRYPGLDEEAYHVNGWRVDGGTFENIKHLLTRTLNMEFIEAGTVNE